MIYQLINYSTKDNLVLYVCGCMNEVPNDLLHISPHIIIKFTYYILLTYY